MKSVPRIVIGLSLVVMLAGGASATCVDFEAFNIRNSNSTINRIEPPWDENLVIMENASEDGFYASTPEGGQKVGYGTSAFDGLSLNLFETVDFTGENENKPGVVPYINFWITDGINYAIISSENDYRTQDFQIRQEWKVFEYDTNVNLDWLFDSGSGVRDGSQYLTLNDNRVTLADFADNIVLADPGSPYPSYVGTGAPRGGFGFNIIFGDTQANYAGEFNLSDLTVTVDGETYCAGPGPAPVPEPASIALFGMGLIGIAARRVRKKV